MRLLNTRTGEFQLVEDPRQEHYAILSHVWAKPGDPGVYVEEQTFQEILQVQKLEASRRKNTLPSKFSDKLRRFCEAALKDGFELGWVDTCCIDKTSSSELSEAINSMYSWYGYSGACYAFLRDVDSPTLDPKWRAAFTESKWFRRGWTLQELIAPRIVIFVSNGWEMLGSKHSLAACISSVTNIDIKVLTFEAPLEEIPIARRMAWAQSRETSRLEDEAYCLMGIFGVGMQTNYGEGRYAFIRLQEAILLQSPDQTIFAWGRFLDEPLTFLPSNSSSTPADSQPLNPDYNTVVEPSFLKQYLLAPSPKEFDPSRSLNVVRLSREVFQQRLGIPIAEDLYQVFEITPGPYGLKTHFPLLPVRSSDKHLTSATHCAILACEDPDKGLLALLLRPRKDLTGNEFFAGAIVAESTARQLALADEPFGRDPSWDSYCRLMYIDPLKLTIPSSSCNCSPDQPPKPVINVSSVYIPPFATRPAAELERDSSIHAKLRETSDKFEVVFCRWSKKVLERDGYSVSRGSGGSQDLDDEQPFSGSESILTRIPSFRSKDTVIISKQDSGVDLIIQVGRCSCEFGQSRGFLAVLVSSGDPRSLDSKDSSPHHPMKHTIHVHSWSFQHGSASRQIEFDSPGDTPQRLSLRLTLTFLTSPQTGTTIRGVRRYRLNAELRELEERERPHPRQPLPLKPSFRLTQMRRNSSESSTPSSLPESSRPGDDGRYHWDVDKKQMQAAVLMFLCGLLVVGGGYLVRWLGITNSLYSKVAWHVL